MEICIDHTIPWHFRVEDGQVLLLPRRELAETQKKWCSIAQVQLTGNNHDDHHGGKHHHSSGASTLRYVDHDMEGDLLKIRLQDQQIELVCYYQFYRDISALRSWACVKNVSKRPVGLDYVASFAVAGIEGNRLWIPHNSWRHEVNWKSYTLGELGLRRDYSASTGRIQVSNTGAWSTKEHLPMGMLQGDSVLLWQIESSGSWHWELSDKAAMLYLHLSGPTEQENGWHKELMPGESFTSVPAAVVFAEDADKAFAEMTKYRRTIAKRPPADRALPVIFNDYMHCLDADPTTEKVLPVIDRAAQAGAEYYVMDAGWYSTGFWWDTVGAWEESRERFPNGLKEVFDYIREKGMVPGIWLEIEVMGIACPILDQFDDSCFFMRHGRRVIDHGRYQLDFRSPKVRAFATSVVDRLVSTLGIGYIKMDYNIEPGIGTEVDADSLGDGLHRHKQAYLAWLDEIGEKYPHLILENCASGGMRMEYASLAHSSLQSLSDQTYTMQTARIAAAAATAVLPEQAAVWSCPLAEESTERLQLDMVNALLTRLHLAGEITKLTEEQLAIVQEGVALHKRIRGSIGESLPFYPCGVPQHEDKLFCAGYRGKETYLAVWRLKTQEDTLILPVAAANPQVLYGNAVLGTCAEGITVILPKEHSACILQLS